MEIVRLRHFLAVAETMHFGRAAENLRMAQPALSRSIKLLETELKVSLFERKHQIALTNAGRVFAKEAKEILNRLQLAGRLAQTAAQDTPQRLRIGFMSSGIFGVLTDGIRQFRQEYPKVKLDLFELMPTEQIKKLRAGELDVCYLGRPLDGIDDLSAVVVLPRNPLYAAIPSSWQLAKRRSIKLADLAKLPFVLNPPDHSPTWRARVDEACKKAGFLPEVAQLSDDTLVVLALVSGEAGVSLAHEVTGRIHMEGVSFVPISDAPATLALDLSLVWVERAMSTPLKSFIDIVCREAEKRERLKRPSAGRARARR